jgi:hypothetical protein
MGSEGYPLMQFRRNNVKNEKEKNAKSLPKQGRRSKGHEKITNNKKVTALKDVVEGGGGSYLKPR